MKRIALSIIIILTTLVGASAQKISLKLRDSATDEEVSYATVSLTTKGAKQASKYVLSDSQGAASFDKVKKGTYVIKAELMGYNPLVKEVTVDKSDIDLGILKMDPDTKVIDAAKVSAVGNPIIVKKDTVEYTASSFKTSDNDMLEQLLKKLPGVEVSEDGSITANGETITKITIDGKTFFLDDPQLASKNLPAKIINKVKVVKKKSEQAEFTGIDDGQEETIIDLSVKKGMMNGIFGNAMAGGGHDIPASTGGNDDYRYQAAFMGGRFTDDSQVSIIANANNTNNRGFNDFSSTAMAGMGMGRGMGRGTGGWGGQNGITESWMAGVNGAFDLFNDKMDLGANYLYNGSRQTVDEKTYKETYLTDGSTLISDSDGYNVTSTWGHRVGARIDHKFSENTSILVQPSINFGGGDFVETENFDTKTLKNGVTSRTNDGFSFVNGNNRNLSTNGFALFRQKLGIPGRTLSVMSNWNVSNNDQHGLNQSLTNTYDQSDILSGSEKVNQRYDRTSKTRSIGARATYTEPIGNNLYVEANYSYNWSLNTSEKVTYDSGLTSDFTSLNHPYISEGEAYNAIYSNSIENKTITQSAGANLAYQDTKLSAQLGLSVNPTSTSNKTIDGGVEKGYDSKVVNWAPQAMLFYNFNDNSDLRFFYRGSSQQPSTNQLMAVMDNSNPLNLSFGNPALTPYFSHMLRSNFGYTNKQTFFSIRGNFNASYVQDPIVNALWYDNSGVQYSMPVNGDDSYNANLRFFVSAPIAKSNFTISNTMRASYSQSSSFIGASSFSMEDYYNSDGSLKYDDFINAFSDIHSREDFLLNKTESLSVMERFELRFRTDYIEIVGGGRTRFNKPWYTIENAADNATFANQVSGSVNWTVGNSGFEAKADANYNWYVGYVTPQESELVLNAEISQLVFKKQATLALKCYDILNQSKNLHITDSANYHEESYNNTLGRYIILSFTWRFGTFGGNKNNRGPRGPMGMGGPGPGPRA